VVDASEVIGDLRNGPILVTRRFRAPVWLSPNGVTGLASTPFDREVRDLASVAYFNERFVALSSPSPSGTGVLVWESPDGETWTRWKVAPSHAPQTITSAGDALFSLGRNASDEAAVRVFGGRERPIKVAELVGYSSATFWHPVTGPAAGRNLVAMRLEVDEVLSVRFAFVDVDNARDIAAFRVEQAGDAYARAVCPQLPTGEIAVLLEESDGVGALIEVWADRSQPRIGAGSPSAGGDFSNAIMFSCALFDDGLLATGVMCSPSAVTDSSYSTEQCQSQIWTSPDGLSWDLHTDAKTLIDADVETIIDAASFGSGALLVGVPNDEDDASTLWLATETDILPVPLDSVFSLGKLDFRHVVVSNDRVLLVSDTEIFGGHADELIRQTLGSQTAITAWNQRAADTRERRAELAVATSTSPAAQSPTTQSPTTQPPATQSPSIPATPAPPPQPPAAGPTTPATPRPTVAPTPARSTSVPVCAPGALTTTGACRCEGGRLYDDGGQCKVRCRGGEQADGFGGCIRSDGTSVDPGASGATGGEFPTTTLVCTTTTNAQTGEVTETCEVVSE